MVNKKYLTLSVIGLLGIVASASVCFANNTFTSSKTAEAAGTPTSGSISSTNTIYLDDNTDDEIISYYSDAGVNGLSGDDLLVALKTKLQDMTYYSYDSGVSKAYLITDRDWTNSPASEISSDYGTYNADTNTITNYAFSTSENPYVHMLYYDYSDGSATHYTGDGADGEGNTSFDKEHVWAQSHGFKASSTASGPAGTDLHNLMAGDSAVNSWAHSNYSYGNVAEDTWVSGTGAKYEHTQKNKLGTSENYNSSVDEENKVFEPQDCDKGDIARALLYMVACYNNLDGSTPTSFNPALKLVDYVVSHGTSGQSSDDLTYGYYGQLSVILEWHKQDPVDEYEIHRNNLIYNNFQHNRNPFIDYPEWVDYIWGTVDESGNYDSTSTGSVDLDTDVINGYNTSDDSSSTTDSISLSASTLSLTVGDTSTLTYTASGTVTWSTSDSSVATVSDGTVTAVSAGTATITATCGTATATCTVTVTASSSGGDTTTPTVSSDTTQTVTITRSSFSSASNYGTAEAWSASDSSSESTYSGYGDISTTTGYMQFNGKNSNASSLGLGMYNSTAFNYKISNITVTYTDSGTRSNSASRYIPVYVGTSELYTYSSTTSFTSNLSSGVSLGNATYTSEDALACSFDVDGNYKYFALGLSNDAIYLASVTITLDLTEYNAYAWASTFLSSTSSICANYDTNTASSFSSVWSELNTSYDALSDGAKGYFFDTSSVSDSDYQSTIVSAIERYNYILSKYSLDDFIGLGTNSNNQLVQYSNNNDTMLSIVIISVMTITLISVGAYLLKKRKEC